MLTWRFSRQDGLWARSVQKCAVLALLVHVHVLGLLHPHAAQVWPDAAVTPVEARPGEHYGERRFAVRVDGLPKREYAGTLEVSAKDGELEFIDVVELEDYVASVVGSELGAGAGQAARDALGVVARTYALLHRDALCDTTHCQLYLGAARRVRVLLREALVTMSGRLAPALHFAACGGRTANAADVWPLAGEDDREAGIAVADGCLAGGTTTELPAGGRSKDGRILRGRGRGHGVGLCQEGAARLASRGLSPHQILSLYFPRLRPLAF